MKWLVWCEGSHLTTVLAYLISPLNSIMLLIMHGEHRIKVFFPISPKTLLKGHLSACDSLWAPRLYFLSGDNCTDWKTTSESWTETFFPDFILLVFAHSEFHFLLHKRDENWKLWSNMLQTGRLVFSGWLAINFFHSRSNRWLKNPFYRLENQFHTV